MLNPAPTTFPAGPVSCPLCKQLAPEFEIEPGLVVNLCSGCKSVWMDKGALAQYLGVPEDFPDPAYSFQHANPTTQVCARCPQHYLERMPYAENAFRVDRCPSCNGLRLDPGEIQLARSYQNRAKLPVAPPPLPPPMDQPENVELTYKDFRMNLLALPLAALFVPIAKLLFLPAFFIKYFCLVLHEFGHATHAWLCSYYAMPYPWGVTSVGESRNLLVYAVFTGIALWMIFNSYREDRKSGMALGLLWMVLQNYATFFLPEKSQQLWFRAGGINGEFLLGTLGCVLFYVRLPQKMRWDFWRIPALVASMYVFIDAFIFWRNVERGKQRMPFGSMLYGKDDHNGDLWRLVEDHDWTLGDITDHYHMLGNIGVGIIVAAYLYGLYRTYPRRPRWTPPVAQK